VAAGPALSDDRWRRFYAAAGENPRETLLHALALHEAEGREPGDAVDLGSGAGRDTLELLRRGWRVLAVDAEPAAMELLQERTPEGARLRTRLGRFDEVEWGDADLVTSSFSLPFAPPPAFARAWDRIRCTLRPGGRFCGQFFGVHDDWASSEDMTFHSRGDVERLLGGLEVERLDEVDEDGRTAVGDEKHWHLFHIVARLP
jgi:tellurite methyltransferase